MAPTRSKRQNQYFDVGKEGRKTGVTVAQQAQDQFGLEDIDNVFSSPAKSTRRNPSRKSLSSKDMELSQGTTTDPADILTARRILKSTNSHLPPPTFNSPLKTNLGSSPRRYSSLGPSARQQRASIGPPIRASSVTRKLNFNADLPQPSIEPRSPVRNSIRRGSRKSASADIYDLQQSPIPDETEHIESIQELEGEDESEVAAAAAAEDDSETRNKVGMVNGLDDYTNGDDYAPAADGFVHDEVEEDSQALPDMTEPVEDLVEPDEPISSPIAQKKRRRNLRTSDPIAEEQSVEGSQLESPEVPVPQRKTRGRPAKSAASVQVKATSQAPSKGKKSSPKKRGRKAKEPTPEPEHELADESAVEDSRDDSALMPPPAFKPPSKSQKRGAAASEEAETGEDSDATKPAPKKRSRSKKADSEEPVSKRPKAAAVPPSSTLFTKPAHRPGPRSLMLLRQTTPFDESNTITRSGRRSIPPLQTWKGERFDLNWDGTINGVRRVEEIEVDKPKRKYSRPKASSRLRPIKEDIDEEEELEEWEAEGDIITGKVQLYDMETDSTSYELHEEEIAHGRNSIIIKDVAGATFKYGKIVSLDFFGAGLLELPVDGFKTKRLSRKMAMVFFVAEGKVRVTVATTEFIISKGGAWQVPRGNAYGIENAGKTTAKIFFAQASEKLVIPGG